MRARSRRPGTGGADRRARGRSLFEAGAVKVADEAQQIYAVSSSSRKGGFYFVDGYAEACTCRDYQDGCPRSGDGRCKHIWAVLFFIGEAS